VLVVANQSDRDAGHVGERFVERGHTLRTVLRESLEVPVDVPGGVGHVLLLGSAWSVAAPESPAALERECALVRSAHAHGVPVLGLCYGAQVLAHVFGGSVSRAPEPEVGLVTVESEDPALVPPGPWWAFHTDVVEPPPTARVVARNGCGVQAFVLPGALGVQFHPEVLPHVLDDWSRRLPALLERVGVVGEDLVAEARLREADSRRAAHALVDAFLGRPTRPPRP
jgi:GMP synthase-like glutamine amidotransferase